jgi:predicted transcriptional regulator
MDKAPPVVNTDERLVDAAGRLLNMDSNAMIAFDDDKPAGLITMRDILRWLVVAEDKSKLVVGDLLSVPLISVGLDATLEDAIRVMSKYGINYLGIQEEKSIKGLVTRQGIKEFCELYPHYF